MPPSTKAISSSTGHSHLMARSFSASDTRSPIMGARSGRSFTSNHKPAM
jgi:hypothetical protein